jgi:mono/diheme cytochrome c family protein
LMAGGTAPDDGHWELPVGSVMVKSFLFRNKMLETRLFVRFADQWAGYSYEWNDAQTEATLVDQFGANKPVMNDAGVMQDWYFPARADCMTCHHEAFGFALGLETIQMSRTVQYPSGVTADQVATLEHLGLFDAPVRPLTPLTNPSADTRPQTLTDRARSYMHANCAICHRPGGEYQGIDMRFGVALKDMDLCNVTPDKGDLGVVGAMRLFPASPAKSMMTLRMLAKDKKSGRMPQLATSVVDTAGVKVVSDWITSIKTCP